MANIIPKQLEKKISVLLRFFNLSNFNQLLLLKKINVL